MTRRSSFDSLLSPPDLARSALSAASILTLLGIAACLQPMPTRPSCGVPGASVACACMDGTRGAQDCQPNGTYAPCQCSAINPPNTLSAPPAQPASPQPAQPAPTTTATASPPCDPAGSWTITRTPKGATNAPGANTKSFIDKWIVLKTNPNTWTAVKSNGIPVKIESVSTLPGHCVVKLTATVEMCATCRPADEIRNYTYTIAINGDKLEGTVELRVDPSVPDADNGAKPEYLSYSAIGTITPFDPSIQIFDKKAAEASFRELYRDFLYECTFETQGQREVEVRLVIAIDGGIKSLQFNSREQYPKTNCPQTYWSFIEDFYSHATGREQSMTFRLTTNE